MGTLVSKLPGCPGIGGWAFSRFEGALASLMAGAVELLPGLSFEGESMPVFSLIGSFDPAVLESAVLASGFCADADSRSGLGVTGFTARLSSSSVGFGPQHRNDRNFGGPFLFGCSVNVLGEPLSGVVG